MIIIHDDIDLVAGAVRVKRGGGHGGHNGLRSLHEKLGSDGYMRVRVGVGRPPGRMDPADWVLQPLKGDALEELEAIDPDGGAGDAEHPRRGHRPRDAGVQRGLAARLAVGHRVLRRRR